MKIFLSALLFGLLAATSALAAKDQTLTVSQSPALAPALGMVIRGSAPTVFTVAPDGGVTRASGDAIRVSNASVVVPTITLRCEPKCNGQPVRVVVRPAGASGDASIVRLRMGALAGAQFVGEAPAASPALAFEIRMVGPSGQASFPLGMDVRLAAGAQGLVQTFSYTVTAEIE